MKKIAGIMIVVLSACAACVFGVGGGIERVFASGAPVQIEFPGMKPTQIVMFEDSVGVFVLKEPGATHQADTFGGGVGLSPNSVNESGWAYSEMYSDWRYDGVSADAGGNWSTTDMIWIKVNPGKKSASFTMSRAVPAGKYGVRATAFTNDEPAKDMRGEIISGIYVILYAEELNYMYCADAEGESTYDTRARGNGLGRTLSIGIFANPGAVHEGSDDQNIGGGYSAGNLTLDVGVSLASLDWHVEDSWGGIFTNERLVFPTVTEKDGLLQIWLPPNLPRGNYVVRVFRDINDSMFGTYVIQNNGVYVGVNADMEMAAWVMLVLGLVLLAGFGVLFLAPRATARINEMRYNSAERKRVKKLYTKDELSAQFTGSTKRVMDAKELEKLTDSEKRILFQKRAEVAKETKGGKFLGKMAENRQKREMARDAGLTMEEFKEIEDRLKKDEKVKEVSLSSFRKALEEKTGVVTIQQEEDIMKKEQKDVRPKTEDGEPEFEMLESEKEKVLDEEPPPAARPAAGPTAGAATGRVFSGSSVPHWKRAFDASDDVPITRSVKDSGADDAAAQKSIKETVDVDKMEEEFDEKYGDKVETERAEKPKAPEQKEENLIVDDPAFIEKPEGYTEPEEPTQKPEENAGARKQDSLSVLQRLKNLSEED